MTIKELIQKLQQFPEDMEVITEGCQFCTHKIIEVLPQFPDSKINTKNILIIEN